VKVYILKIPKLWSENMLKYAPNFSPLREKSNNMRSRLKNR
jgi:hypothetical protein